MSRILASLALLLALALPLRAEIDIQRITTPGGFSAWLVEEHSIPFTALEIRFRGGASLDPPGKRGAINLMTATLEEGAGDLDARAFAEARDSLAAELHFDVGPDALSVSARMLTENRAEAAELLRLALNEPRFDADAVERVKGQVLSIIRSDQKDPDKIAYQTFNRLAYGDHPYGSSINGTIESVTPLTPDDMREAKDRVIARDRVYIAAVGDITPEELRELIDDLLADLPAKGAPMPPDAPWLLDGGQTLVPFPTPQSVAVFGEPGIGMDDPDFFAAYVLNEIVGGSGLQSRLMREVREKRGLTYGVYTYLLDRDHADALMGQVASANDRMAKAIEVIRDEWERLQREGVTDEELERAKKYMTGAYPLRFDGNGQIANILVGMQMNGMPPEYINTRNAKIEAVTQEDIRRVIKRLFRPEKLHFVVVGQPEGLEAQD